MALQIFMKIEGISGDSKHYEYKGWSDVLSWNWGMTSNRKLAHGDDGDKTTMNEISIIKPMGIDSPGIRLLFAQGKAIPTVELSATPVVSKREIQTKYISIKMEDVRIKSIISGGGVEDSFFKEHLTLLFDRVTFEFSHYAAASSDGKAGAKSDFDFAWNVGSNVEVAQ
jgi:type VI secretion system secreted protein Hcp